MKEFIGKVWQKIKEFFVNNWQYVLFFSLVITAIVIWTINIINCSNEVNFYSSISVKADADYEIEFDEGDSDYYYNQLSGDSKTLYKMIHKTFDEYWSGKRTPKKLEEDGRYYLASFKLSDFNLKETDENVAFIAYNSFTRDNLSFCLGNDHYGIRYTGIGDGGCQKTIGGDTYFYIVTSPEYMKIVNNQENIKAALERNVQELQTQISPSDSPLIKYGKIYDFVAQKTEYARDEKGEPVCNGYTASMVSVFDGDENTHSICQGYARALAYLCNRFGVECVYVDSAKIVHAFNAVKIEDAWYYSDVTNADGAYNLYAYPELVLGGEKEYWNIHDLEQSYTNDEYGNYGLGLKAPTFSQEIYPTETSDETFKYTLDFRKGGYVVTGLNADVKELQIPVEYKGIPIKEIGKKAFYDCSGLTSITIPDSVTSIGERAFYDCSGLTSITIPDSVTSIGEQAFYDCSGLTSITIPDSVTSIGERAFYGCNGLTSITIPDSVTLIEKGAFGNCENLTEIVVGFGNQSYVTMGDNLYTKDGKILLKYLEKQGNGSFVIPDGVTTIDSCAFYGCSGLTNITIPDSVTLIDDYAFYNCSGLTNLAIPESVTMIGISAFSGCVGLTSIIIPDGITAIERFTFDDCSGLTSIEIPDSVTSIGQYAFSDCTSLTSITIPDGVTLIERFTFSGCIGLTSITIPDGVTCIEARAFSNCSGLTSIEIPDSVTSIGDYAFYECNGLTSIAIPDNITAIGDYMFSGCSNLTSITISDNVISIGNRAFSGCSGLKDITIPDSVTKIGIAAFLSCNSLTSITIPDGVTIIKVSAFSDCSELISVTIPSSVIKIEGFAFAYCNNLKCIRFEGTMAEWRAIEKENFWGHSSFITQIICTDGNIQ